MVLLSTVDTTAWCLMQVSQALTGQRLKGTRRAYKRRKSSRATDGPRAQEPPASDGEEDDDDDDDEVMRIPIYIEISGSIF